jgi:hypothetical protein
MRCIIPIFTAILLMFLSYSSSTAQISIQPVRWGLPITIPSPLESNSWFPNLAVDSKGTVHIIWCETYSPDGTDFLDESIFYTTWNGNQWSQFTDVASPIREIRRNSLTIDDNDILHMSFIDSFANNPYRLGYRSAAVENAFSTNNWSPVVHINDRGQSYMNEIVVFENTIHVLYEDTGSSDGVCPGCADIFYRRSMDGGLNWDAPVSLLPTRIGTARPHLSVDRNGTLYASWDEGWDRHSGKGTPEYSVFTFSMNLGETWVDPVEIRHLSEAVSQLAIEGNGEGGIMLVWRTMSPDYPGVYFQWSNDGGSTWSQPGTLPNFRARPGINYFDSYDMAVDSTGHIHVLATGFLSSNEGRIGDRYGLYHFEWDGVRWYPPTQVYNGGLYPEYARLVIDKGNELHASWFVRHDLFLNDKAHEIMYAKGFAAAPKVERIPVSQLEEVTSEISSSIEVFNPGGATQVPVVVPQPTLDNTPFASSDVLYTEADELEIIFIGLAPVVLIIGALIVVVRKRQR